MTQLGQHQLKAIRELKNGSILRGGVGSGKTRTALVYFWTHIVDGRLPVNGIGDWQPPKRPIDLYVITTAKKRNDLDWEQEAVDQRVFVQGEYGIQMTVDSWNNIGKYAEVRDAFFIFDEQRLVGTGAWVKAFYKIAKANQWILLSATPGDTWMDYIPVFVANGFFKSRSEFTREHVVFKPFMKFPKIDRFIGEMKLRRLRDSITVEMPYERHTKRHMRYVNVEYDRQKYDMVVKKRWNVFTEEPLEDVSQMFVAMRRVVNGDISRYGAVLQLMEKHPKLIIFYNFDYELELLRTLSNIGFTVAEWNGHRHQPVPTGDSWIYLVQYTAGAEGWNCTETDAMIFWSLNYSYKIFEQAQGRIDRLNTRFVDLNYYLLLSEAPIDRAILKSLNAKEDFNERSFEDSWPKTQI